MSRLDDELKIAFRRQEPSPDFTARLIERINSSPAPRPDFRQRLAAWFSMPRFRWVAIGATAVLLVAIGVAEYGRLHQTTVKDDGKLTAVNPAGTGVDQINEWGNKAPKVDASERPRTHLREPRKFRLNAVAIRREPQPSPEAEAAKERVLFALQVAGATLNDAQRAIQDDGPKDKPEPLNNR
jgi:anti-sigma-K factor RskA